MTTREIARRLRRLPRPEVPEGLPERLLAAAGLSPARRQRRLGRRLALGGAALFVAVGLMLWPSRSSDSVLAAVATAVTQAQPTHIVTEFREVDKPHSPLVRLTEWRRADGLYRSRMDSVSEFRPAPLGTSWHLGRPDGAMWNWMEGPLVGASNVRHLWWQAGRPLPGRPQDLTLPDGRPLPLRMIGNCLMANLRGGYGDICSVTAEPCRIDGRDAVDVTIRTRLPGGPYRRDTSPPAEGEYGSRTIHVTLDTSYQRILRVSGTMVGAMLTQGWSGGDVRGSIGYQTWSWETTRLDYQPEPDPALFRLPLEPDTICYGGGPNQVIDPAWDRMTDPEHDELRSLFTDLDRAITTGDADLLLSLFDPAALPSLQAKGKATPERMRTQLRDWVVRQPSRFTSYQTRLDYVYGTRTPPMFVASWHGVERLMRLKSDVLVGLALVTAQMPGEETPRQVRTRLWLRKIDGHYKLIAWHPPLG